MILKNIEVGFDFQHLKSKTRSNRRAAERVSLQIEDPAKMAVKYGAQLAYVRPENRYNRYDENCCMITVC